QHFRAALPENFLGRDRRAGAESDRSRRGPTAHTCFPFARYDVRLYATRSDTPRTAKSVSGAISAPFGQHTVPPATKNWRNSERFRRGSNTGPSSQREKSRVFRRPVLKTSSIR